MTRQLDALPYPGIPSPGLELRRAVDSALAALLTPPTAAAARALADDLLGALARTAAAGDTCLVLAAAEAVGQARAHLVAGRGVEARASLVAARGLLDRRER
ncbi:hypothetical protein V5P93_002846 [Actinokineospora auranticolor]|uniref:Uncharacterized protein n=1 Tax=Actinokineospora auranticolor TaxID=155976 RepID=A0A2S6H0Q0_9PSEU|nr:hypothetical protein [Actinokineospora auranticolor]PPK70987.1 hypothetical protein CLV40_101173 [Actinokineospora auranticolor]